MQKYYTLAIYTENVVGLLSRVTAVFTRRHINIESLTVSETEVRGISRITVGIHVSHDMIGKITKQLNKIVEVIHAEYQTDSDLIVSELALYKVDMTNMKKRNSLEALAIQNNARILTSYENHIILEKTGDRTTLEAFLNALKKYGETEYVRSGRIALTLQGIRLQEIWPNLAEMNNYIGYHWDRKIDGSEN